MRDSWLGLCARQLSRDKNLELIIYLLNRDTRGSLWKRSYLFVAVPAAFRVFPNFYSWFYNSMKSRTMFHYILTRMLNHSEEHVYIYDYPGHIIPLSYISRLCTSVDEFEWK